MTDKVLIILSCGTDNPNRSTRALHLATIAHQEGKQVNVFLMDEGVYLARKNIAVNVRAATGDALDDHIAYLQAHSIPIIACTPCAKARQIETSDLIEGARMGTAAELINAACDSAVISL